MRSCFLFGSRIVQENIYPVLLDALRRYIENYAVEEFITGTYGGFDRMAARATAEIKETYKEIRLSILSPYHPSQRHINMPEGADGIIYPPDMETTPARLTIVRANRYIVDHSDYIIAYVPYAAGNSGKLLDYARKRAQSTALYIENIAVPSMQSGT